MVGSEENIVALFRVVKTLNVKTKSLAVFAFKSVGSSSRHDLWRRSYGCFARFRGSGRRRCGRCDCSAGIVL